MLDTYFFIPANRPEFLKKIPSINADVFVIDMEDTVDQSEWDSSISNIKKYTEIDSHYIRPNLFENGRFSLNLLKDLISNNAKYFIFPKLSELSQVNEIFKLNGICKSIILVETPKMLLSLKDVISNHNIHGVGFGSNDFSMYTGIKDSSEYMNYFRIKLKMIALEFDITLIDTASMNLYDDKAFKRECINAFNLGFDGKFLIHPNQLLMLQSTEFFSDEEVQWAIEVMKFLESYPESEIKAHKINGQVLEKPHYKKLQNIKKYLNFKNQSI